MAKENPLEKLVESAATNDVHKELVYKAYMHMMDSAVELQDMKDEEGRPISVSEVIDAVMTLSLTLAHHAGMGFTQYCSQSSRLWDVMDAAASIDVEELKAMFEKHTSTDKPN